MLIDPIDSIPPVIEYFFLLKKKIKCNPSTTLGDIMKQLNDY